MEKIDFCDMGYLAEFLTFLAFLTNLLLNANKLLTSQIFTWMTIAKQF